MNAEGKVAELRQRIRGMKSVAVAFSGGTDSSLLLKVAVDELGGSAIAFLARSPSFPMRELEAARSIASEIGADLMEIDTSELAIEEYASNGQMRCYHCKRAIMSGIISKARLFNLAHVVDGSNADDRKETRQGTKALDELGIGSPLADVGMTKEEVRAAARSIGLTNWDRPSSACLASRVPYGVRITRELLTRIEKSEDLLISFGVGQVRLRAHGDVARIEVLHEDFDKVMRNRLEIVKGIKALGFRYVTLDIEGFRTGSLEI